MSEAAGSGDREEQLAYSETMAKMLDEAGRRQKAAKIVAVVRHALGVASLDGLRAVDVGCSAGFIADELALAGRHHQRGRHRRAGAREGPARFGERVDFRLRPSARTCPSTTTRSTSRCSTTSTSTSSTPRPSWPTSTGCCARGGCSTSASGTAGRCSNRTTGCPFLSWLPQGLADRYLRVTGKGEHYYEHYYTPAGLRRLFAAYDVWDYTLPVLTDPVAFAAADNVPAWARRCRRRPSGRRCPSCPPTCGRRSRGRPPRRAAAARAAPPPVLTAAAPSGAVGIRPARSASDRGSAVTPASPPPAQEHGRRNGRALCGPGQTRACALPERADH